MGIKQKNLRKCPDYARPILKANNLSQLSQKSTQNYIPKLGYHHYSVSFELA